MATVLRGSRGPLRLRCGRWLQWVETAVLALLLSVLLSVPTVRAQTLSSDGSLNWGIKSSGPSTSSVVGTSLVIAGAAAGLILTLTPPGAIAGAGAATLALTGRAFTLAGSYVGPIAATMLRQAVAKGPLTGTMLALAVALGSDATYNAASNSFTSKNPSDPTPMSGDGSNMTCQALKNAGLSMGQSVNYSRSDGTKLSLVLDYADGGIHGGYTINSFCSGVYPANPASGQPAGLWYKVVSSFPPAGTPVASTDAQLSSAVQAPAALAKVWDAGGCPAKVTTYRDTIDPADPCAVIIGNPNGTWTPVTVPNGGSVSFPPTTETTKDAAGNVIGTKTTTPTAQVTANTVQGTMAGSPVIVQGGQTVVNSVKNADGSTTTTTTTTANPSQSTEQPQDGSATFSGGDAALYNKKSKTFSDVLTSFQTALNGAPWMQAAKGFFSVSFGSAACPHWTVAANRWVAAPLDAGVYFCSQTALVLYGLGGVIVLAVAAWAAFRIAFL